MKTSLSCRLAVALFCALAILSSAATTTSGQEWSTGAIDLFEATEVASLLPSDIRAICSGGGPPTEERADTISLFLTRNRDAIVRVMGQVTCPPREEGRRASSVGGQVLTLRGRFAPAPDGLVLYFGNDSSAASADAAGALLWHGEKFVSSDREFDVADIDRILIDPRRDPTWSEREAVARGQSFPYDCSNDPLLEGGTVAADTAGLGALLTSLDDGLRLATEREMACSKVLDANLMETAGSHPIRAVSMFGSGAAWWVLRADFDGNDVTDIYTFVISGDQPAPRPIVVMNGTKLYDLDLPGVASIIPAGIPVYGCDPRSSLVLETDALAHPRTGGIYFKDGAFHSHGVTCKEY